jgi:BMFP domain-containing protein YqiC
MQSQSKIFDDFAKVATGAAGTFAGTVREFEAQTREKVRDWLGGLDMVTRDEFEACRTLAARAMSEVELLKTELAVLKAARATAATPAAPATPSPDQAEHGAGPDGAPTL